MNNKRLSTVKAIILLALAVASGKAGAQEVVFNADFNFGNEGTDQAFNGNDRFNSNEWVFSTCFSIKGGYLQVGSNSANTGGYVQTPPITGLSEYAMITLEVVNSNPSAKTITLSTDNSSCELSASTLKIPKNSSVVRLTSILKLNGVVSPKLKIAISTPSFDLKAITVTNIDDILMYESFSNVNGGTNVGVTDFTAPLSVGWDNHVCPDFDYTKADQMGCKKGNACIYIQSSSNSSSSDDIYYQTPQLSALNKVPNGKVLLRFRAAGGTGGSGDRKVELTGSSGVSFSTSSFTLTEEVWTQYEVVVTGFTKNSQIKFRGYRAFLDDILITEEPTITLSDTDTDDSKISFNKDGLRTVQLNRTLGAGYWNTLCLPFDVTKTMLEQAFDSGADPVINILESVDGGIFNFTSEESVAAGTPFLLKVKKQVVNPTFTEVVIKEATPKTVTKTSNGKDYSFVGTYSKTTLTTDGTNLFLGNDGNLYYPADGDKNVMNGLRAYFVVPNGSGVRVVADDNEGELGVESISATHNGHTIIYNVLGQPCNSRSLTRGMYIINGKKIIVR